MKNLQRLSRTINESNTSDDINNYFDIDLRYYIYQNIGGKFFKYSRLTKHEMFRRFN